MRKRTKADVCESYWQLGLRDSSMNPHCKHLIFYIFYELDIFCLIISFIYLSICSNIFKTRPFHITSSFQCNERGLWIMRLSTLKKKSNFFCCKTSNLQTNTNDCRMTNKARSSFQSRAAAAETHKIVQNGAIEACLMLALSVLPFLTLK